MEIREMSQKLVFYSFILGIKIGCNTQRIHCQHLRSECKLLRHSSCLLSKIKIVQQMGGGVHELLYRSPKSEKVRYSQHFRFINIDQMGKAIEGSEQYEMIDTSKFFQVLNTQLSQELSNFFHSCQALKKSTQLINTVIEKIRIETNKIIIEIKDRNSLSMFCKESQLDNSTDSKQFIVKCGVEFKQWYGYCPKCRKNEKHQIKLKIITKNEQNIAQNNSQMEFYNYRSQIIDKNRDYRLIDFSQFQQQIYNYIQNQVLDIMIQLRYQTISTLKKQFMSLFDRENKNKEQIMQLNQQIRKTQLPKLKKIQIKQNLQIQQIQTFEQMIFYARMEVEQLKEANLYDIQINCTNLSDLTTVQGWQVVTSKTYEQQKNANCSVVSFYGFFNKGKSFLASKLCGIKIPSNYSTTTIGLSALYLKENSIIFLDTAGLEKPINHHKIDEIYTKYSKQNFDDDSLFQKLYEAKTMDRVLTENLIQQFVFTQSDLILIVVDQLTKEEQKLIKRIRIKYEKSQIMIVHNFINLTRVEEVQKYIEIDILKSFENVTPLDRKLGEVSGQVYKEQSEVDSDSIIHVVMAKENSRAGKQYNPFCYKYIENKMSVINKYKKFDLISNLMSEVECQISKIFQIDSEMQNQQPKLQYNKNMNAITANLQDAELKPFSLDFLGFLHLYDECETPKFNYHVSNDKLILNLELCGKFEPQQQDLLYGKFFSKCSITGFSLLEWHGFDKNNQLILVRGQFLGPISQLLCQPMGQDPSYQRSKRFQLIVNISPMQYVLGQSQSIFTFQQGIGRFEFKIQKNRQIIQE